MEPPFSQPQRQSALGILILFLNSLQRWLRALGPVIVLYLFKTNTLNKTYLWLGFFLVLMVIALTAYLRYLHFSFFLDTPNNAFVVQEGVFNKTKTSIQLDKIQQVTINQSFLQRLVQVYEINVDTAGSAQKEVQIKAISHEVATALRAKLLKNKKELTIASPEDALDPNPEEAIASKWFLKISFWSLLKVGITSNYVRTFGLILAFLVSVYDTLRNVISESDLEAQNQQINTWFTQSSMLITGLVLLFVLVLLINTLRVVFQYYRYTITKQKDSLLLSYGLWNTKSTLIQPEKVQLVTITRNYFQKKMHILELKIKQASSTQNQQKKDHIEIPGCNETEKQTVLELIYNTLPTKGLVLRPNYRKLVFSVFVYLLVPLMGYLVWITYIDPTFSRYWFAAVGFAVLGSILLFFGFKNNRLYITDAFIIKQSGAWDVATTILEPKKIQAITTTQFFWHKKANIGSITIHTAGGTLSFQLGNFSTIQAQVNLWLYTVETTNSNWM
ncbi:PH domain-containing protein [Flavobacterium crassostreae]|uniref:YdbS-like PH domain-containing protein n=1 Tax=Flavobacterium crassostreae TaxID=1763534 RepID=A0A1B9E290_9FLAO|nr:PH domain-containing protein [Flavobacterium crassostreae]OCB76063.1 hypothetical protein LPBF_07065 [Flavobacterium crassostreae]